MTKADFERSRGETLDESIDRVAASLTAVPPDPGFAARMDAQLAARPSRLPVWVVASAAAAVLFAAVILNLDRQHAPAINPPSMAAAVESRPAPVLSDNAQGQPDSSPAPQAEAHPTRQTRRPQPRVIEPSVAAIAALPAPLTLNVDELTVESLTIAPVEFGHLDLASLEVRDIESVGEPKEQ